MECIWLNALHAWPMKSLTTESMVNMSETEVNVKVLPFVSVNSCVFFAL